MKLIFGSLVFACLSVAAFAQDPIPEKGVVEYRGEFRTQSFFPQVSPLLRPPVERDRDEKVSWTLPIGPPNSLQHNFTGTLNTGPQFDHYSENMTGIAESTFDPADPDIAVGPTHVVQVVNTAIAFFDKRTGKMTFQQALDTVPGDVRGIFEPYIDPASLVFDPRCWYDPGVNRFFVTVMEVNKTKKISRIHIGFSAGSSPEGSWSVFSANVVKNVGTKKYWADYNTAGYNKDAIVLPYLSFDFVGDTFWGSRVLIIPKAKLIAGQTLTTNTFDQAGIYTIAAMRSHDNTVDKIYGTHLRNTTTIRIYAWSSLTAATPKMNYRDIIVPVVKPNTRDGRAKNGRILDSGADRTLSTVYRAGRLFTAHSEPTASTGTYKVGFSFYEFATNDFPVKNPSKIQSGFIYSSAAEDWLYPSVAVNADGDFGVIATASSATLNPRTIFLSRKATDVKGKLPKAIVVKPANTTDYKSKAVQRWGDYFGMAIDPSDGLTFWGTAMVTNGTKWGTTVFAHANRGVTDNTSFPTSFYKNQGVSATGKVADLVSIDGKGVAMAMVKSGTYYVASIDVYTTVVGDVTRGRSIKVSLASKGTANVNMSVWIYNNKKFQYEHVGNWKNVLAGTGNLDFLVSGPFTDYLTASGQVLMNVQVYNPTSAAATLDLFKVAYMAHKK